MRKAFRDAYNRELAILKERSSEFAADYPGLAERLGGLMVAGMPKVLSSLSVIGIAAMLWVGGHILLVGLDELGWTTPYHLVHLLEEAVRGVAGVGGVLAWVVNTVASALVGLVIGSLIVLVVERLPFRRSGK